MEPLLVWDEVAGNWTETETVSPLPALSTCFKRHRYLNPELPSSIPQTFLGPGVWPSLGDKQRDMISIIKPTVGSLRLLLLSELCTTTEDDNSRVPKDLE